MAAVEPVSFCFDVDRFPLSPFQELRSSGQFEALSLLMRPLFSPIPEIPSVLEAMSFSEGGTRLVARVRPDAKWLDGSPVQAREVADSIFRTLPFRSISDRVQVAVRPSRKKGGASEPDIDVIDSRNFTMKFLGASENIPGLIRDSFSDVSAASQFWVVRTDFLSGNDYGKRKDFVSRYPARLDSQGRPIVKIGGSEVIFLTRKDCIEPQLARLNHPKVATILDNFHIRRSPKEFALHLAFDGKRVEKLERRQAIAVAFRAAVATVPRQLAFFPAEAFFLRGESGYSANPWQTASSSPLGGSLRLNAGGIQNSKSLSALLASVQSSNGLHVELVPDMTLPADAALFSVPITEGRQPWMQEFPSDSGFWLRKFLLPFSKTLGALERISQKSAATLSLDNSLLMEFEKAARSEWSIVPLARFGQSFAIRMNSPVDLTFVGEGLPHLVPVTGD